jgi:hypothetical protein
LHKRLRFAILCGLKVISHSTSLLYKKANVANKRSNHIISFHSESSEIMSKNTPEQPANASSRESADEKMVKALVHQAMRSALGKRDSTLLAVAQQMIDTGEVKEKSPPPQQLSDEELQRMLDNKRLE